MQPVISIQYTDTSVLLSIVEVVRNTILVRFTAVEMVQSYRKIGVRPRATLHFTSCMHSSPAMIIDDLSEHSIEHVCMRTLMARLSERLPEGDALRTLRLTNVTLKTHTHHMPPRRWHEDTIQYT